MTRFEPPQAFPGAPVEAVCPSCRGRLGRIERVDGYEVFRPCACQAARRRDAIWDGLGIPPRYEHASLDEPSQWRDAQAAVSRETSLLWLAQSWPQQRGLLLHGPVGVGKTHLVAAILRRLTVALGVPSRFIDYGQLIVDLKWHFDTPGADRRLIEPLAEVPVLAIDELGKGRANDWESSVLDDLVSRRYNARRVTLFTTNLVAEARRRGEGLHARADRDKQQSAFGGGETLEERFGERVFSRMVETCDFVAVSGRDRRMPEPPRARR
jgi:DNA replication protein DnaC